MRVLNVGGGTARDLPPTYNGWAQDVLDIDPAVAPDIVCDAKAMQGKVKRSHYDAVFCSHNLEHFYRHEVPAVLGGFMHALKPAGFAQIAVPDMAALFEAVRGRDIGDTWYIASGTPISFHDVIYGWGLQVSKGNLYYSHKCGFTDKTLTKALTAAKFVKVYTATDQGNLHAFAFKSKPTKDQLRSLGI